MLAMTIALHTGISHIYKSEQNSVKSFNESPPVSMAEKMNTLAKILFVTATLVFNSIFWFFALNEYHYAPEEYNYT